MQQNSSLTGDWLGFIGARGIVRGVAQVAGNGADGRRRVALAKAFLDEPNAFNGIKFDRIGKK